MESKRREHYRSHEKLVKPGTGTALGTKDVHVCGLNILSSPLLAAYLLEPFFL